MLTNDIQYLHIISITKPHRNRRELKPRKSFVSGHEPHEFTERDAFLPEVRVWDKMRMGQKRVLMGSINRISKMI
mgnify:CR=1 FL=1